MIYRSNNFDAKNSIRNNNYNFGNRVMNNLYFFSNNSTGIKQTNYLSLEKQQLQPCGNGENGFRNIFYSRHFIVYDRQNVSVASKGNFQENTSKITIVPKIDRKLTISPQPLIGNILSNDKYCCSNFFGGGSDELFVPDKESPEILNEKGQECVPILVFSVPMVNQIACPHCTASFRVGDLSKNTLGRHLSQVHKIEICSFKYKCRFCNFKSDAKHALRVINNHVAAKHSNFKTEEADKLPFACSKCPASFSSQRRHDTHNVSKHEKPKKISLKDKLEMKSSTILQKSNNLNENKISIEKKSIENQTSGNCSKSSV